MGSTSQVQIKQDSLPAVRARGQKAPVDGKASLNTLPPEWDGESAEADYPEEVLGATVDLGGDAASLQELETVPVAEVLDGVASGPIAGDEIAEEPGVAAEAAESFIAGKRIGDRIKYLRQRKQMGLVELGRYTGLSASFLSQLETGRVVPTLRNLARLAMVFSKDLSYFFEPERPELFRILRADERTRHPQTGADEPGYFFETLGHVPMEHSITPYFAEFLPGNGRRAPRAHQHSGAEFLYMLTGELQITHNSVSTAVEEGDAVYFNSSAPHSYERQGEELCTALILTMPEPLRGIHTGSRVPQAVPSKTQVNGSASRDGASGKQATSV